MDSWQKQCNDLFPPGTNNSLPPSPDTSKVTMYGNLNITGSRLAVLSGQLDAWLPVSALTTGRDTGEGYLIPFAGHVFDFNYSPSASKDVMAVQKMLVPEVASWFQNDLASFLQNISVPGSDPKKWHDPTHTLDHVWIPATDEERLLFSQAFINPNPLIPGGVAPPTSPSNTTTTSNTTTGQGAGSWSPTSGWVTNGAASPQTSSVAVSLSVPINTPASVPAPAATTTVAVPDTVMQPNTSTANDALVVGALADGDNDASKVSGALTDQELDDYYRERRDYYRRRSIIAGAIIGGILLLTVVGLLLYSKPWRRRRTLAQNGRQQIYRPVNPDAGVSRPSFGDGGMQHPSAPAYDHVPLLNREDNNTPAPHYAPPPGPPPPSYGFAPPSLPPPGSSSVAAPPRIPSPEIESTKEENEYRQSVDEKRPLRDGES